MRASHACPMRMRMESLIGNMLAGRRAALLVTLLCAECMAVHGGAAGAPYVHSQLLSLSLPLEGSSSTKHKKVASSVGTEGGCTVHALAVPAFARVVGMEPLQGLMQPPRAASVQLVACGASPLPGGVHAQNLRPASCVDAARVCPGGVLLDSWERPSGPGAPWVRGNSTTDTAPTTSDSSPGQKQQHVVAVLRSFPAAGGGSADADAGSRSLVSARARDVALVLRHTQDLPAPALPAAGTKCSSTRQAGQPEQVPPQGEAHAAQGQGQGPPRRPAPTLSPEAPPQLWQPPPSGCVIGSTAVQRMHGCGAAQRHEHAHETGQRRTDCEAVSAAFFRICFVGVA
jgi:hypothetical protein